MPKRREAGLSTVEMDNSDIEKIDSFEFSPDRRKTKIVEYDLGYNLKLKFHIAKYKRNEPSLIALTLESKYGAVPLFRPIGSKYAFDLDPENCRFVFYGEDRAAYIAKTIIQFVQAFNHHEEMLDPLEVIFNELQKVIYEVSHTPIHHLSSDS